MTVEPVDAESRAKQRYVLMNLARFASILVLMAGIAAARGILPVPYAVGVFAAVGGMLSFFFTPPMLAKRWRQQDNAE